MSFDWNMMILRPLMVLFVFLAALCGRAQQYCYCGPNKPMGDYRNEVTGGVQGGSNVVTGFFMGPQMSYMRHITPRWSAGGAVDLSFGKEKYGVYATGGYRLPVSKFDFYFKGKVMYNRYARSHTDEWAYNVCAIWEGSHFDVTIGWSVITFTLLNSTCVEPVTPTFGVSGHIMPRSNSWNIGLFFRNYDEFYYENWNINWGLNFYASLTGRLKLYGEFDIRPAGSLNQLATNYETSAKAVVRYFF